MLGARTSSCEKSMGDVKVARLVCQARDFAEPPCGQPAIVSIDHPDADEFMHLCGEHYSKLKEYGVTAKETVYFFRDVPALTHFPLFADKLTN